ncbi:hypothetical protein [Robertmurraya sp. P23]
MEVSFGQEESREQELSLNRGVIRTGRGQVKVVESEWRCHSDKKRAGEGS